MIGYSFYPWLALFWGSCLLFTGMLYRQARQVQRSRGRHTVISPEMAPERLLKRLLLFAAASGMVVAAIPLTVCSLDYTGSVQTLLYAVSLLCAYLAWRTALSTRNRPAGFIVITLALPAYLCLAGLVYVPGQILYDHHYQRLPGVVFHQFHDGLPYAESYQKSNIRRLILDGKNGGVTIYRQNGPDWIWISTVRNPEGKVIRHSIEQSRDGVPHGRQLEWKDGQVVKNLFIP